MMPDDCSNDALYIAIIWQRYKIALRRSLHSSMFTQPEEADAQIVFEGGEFVTFSDTPPRRIPNKDLELN